ncbi:MAG: dicarboxylate/amino acid:cation symporter [Clostridiales Family XIII bacterium]|jgi:Na+/H+-dicarboxylate symporter|nr:dicarboxylate/amino acid:cation symporter [Clostridiales Family XIII bacterium]
MSFDGLSAAALALVIALFAVLFVLRRKGLNFSLSIVGGLILGLLVGYFFTGHTGWITPLGKIYVSVLNAIVCPLIIVSILSSVTSLGSAAQLKGIGLRSVFWLLVTTAASIALALGLGLAFGIGNGANLTIEGVDASVYEGTLTPFSQVLIGFFPRNVIADIADEKIIPILLFSALIAVSYVLVAQKNREKVVVFKHFVDAVKGIIFKAVGFVIELTPFAVLALMATITGNGLSREGILTSLLVLLAVSFLAFAIDTWAVNYVLLRSFARLAPLRFFKKLVPAQLIGFSTQSSAGTLPVTTRLLTERIGVPPSVANFTAPLGTTIGMPGCAGIWPILVAVYGIHGLGIPYTARDYVVLAVAGLFVSLGVAGVPGTATIVTASVLTAVGLPIEIMVLTIPVTAIADTGRTATNITAAATCAAIVARKEGVLDEEVYYDRKPASWDAPDEGSGEVRKAGAAAAAATTATGAGADEPYAVPIGACKIG